MASRLCFDKGANRNVWGPHPSFPKQCKHFSENPPSGSRLNPSELIGKSPEATGNPPDSRLPEGKAYSYRCDTFLLRAIGNPGHSCSLFPSVRGRWRAGRSKRRPYSASTSPNSEQGTAIAPCIPRRGAPWCARGRRGRLPAKLQFISGL